MQSKVEFTFNKNIYTLLLNSLESRLLTLYIEVGVTSQVSHYGGVLSSVTRVQVLDDELVGLPLHQDLTLVARQDLHIVEHPLHRDIVM